MDWGSVGEEGYGRSIGGVKIAEYIHKCNN